MTMNAGVQQHIDRGSCELMASISSSHVIKTTNILSVGRASACRIRQPSSAQFAFCLAALPRCYEDPLNSTYHKVQMLTYTSLDTRVSKFSNTAKPREHPEI